MARPYRPHPSKKPTSVSADSTAYKSWKASHPKQETRPEAKARKRAEAEERNAHTRPEDRRQARLQRQREVEAQAEEKIQALADVVAEKTGLTTKEVKKRTKRAKATA